MMTVDQIGLYGKGAMDVAKARAAAKKALEMAAKDFSKTKPFNCTVHPLPKPPAPAAPQTPGKST